ncbi:MAG: hypothetical protein DMG50_26600 [Acidobacteria bacterium]|nr:MAG: hypothetical protein DMG50_26600 [Acidobacteriota bacterium]
MTFLISPLPTPPASARAKTFWPSAIRATPCSSASRKASASSPSALRIFSRFSIASIPTPCRSPKNSPPPRVNKPLETAGQPLASEGTESSESSKISSSSAPDGVGTVTVSSDLDGAEIFIDDKFLGNAPATLKLSPGSHAVLLKLPGHTDWRRTRSSQVQ